MSHHEGIRQHSRTRSVFKNDWEISDITHWRLRREAAECGLELVETKSFNKYISINWFARLRKLR